MRALRDSPDFFGSTYALESAFPDATWVERAERSALAETSVTFVAESPAGWVGMVAGHLEDERRPQAGLFGLWVEQSARGAGVGLALTEAVVDWARTRGAKTVTLWVIESNVDAIRLYRRAGFLETEDRKGLTRQPSLIELRMEKQLG